MPHIHAEPGQHDHTVSAFIVRLDKPEPRLLLHRHKKLGLYMQFGGHIELDETPWQALEHELREESGYELEQLLLLQPVNRIKHLTGVALHPLPFCYSTHVVLGTNDHYHTDSCYVFTTTGEPVTNLDAGESEEMTLLSAKELRCLSSREILENVREMGLYILEDLLDSWEQVPAHKIG